MRRAHRSKDVAVRDRRECVDSEFLKAARLDTKCGFLADSGSPRRGCIPPKPDKAYVAKVVSHPPDGGQQPFTHFSPTPPIMAQMHDVNVFGVGGAQGGVRIVAVKQQRLHRRLGWSKG